MLKQAALLSTNEGSAIASVPICYIKSLVKFTE